MIYRFDDLELDVGRHQLRRGGEALKLPKLSFRLLEVLVEAAPDMVSHDELITRVWGANRVISPENLSKRILMLRHSLGEDVNQPVYIDSVRGEGVRIIPPVTAESPGELEPAGRAGLTPVVGWSIAGAVAVLGVVMLLASPNRDAEYQREVDSLGDRQSSSIAVLPFSNLSPDPRNGFYAAGIHEEVLNQLAKLTRLRVISRTSMLRYENTRQPIPEIARQLAVDSLVEGSVRYADNRLRVTIQLVDGDSDEHLWSETYERELEDIFAIESDIARDVAVALRQVLPMEAGGRQQRPPTTSLEAYAEYVQGRQAMVLRKPKELLEAVQHFKRATEFDPEYVLAWVGLADSLSLLAGYSGQNLKDTFAERQAAIDRALELDPLAGEAWLSFAVLKQHQGLRDEAEEDFLRSIELNPSNAQAHLWYGAFLLDAGRTEEALPPLRQSVALDPLGLSATTALIKALWFLGRAEEALALVRKLIERAPDYAPGYSVLSAAFARLGRLDEATYWAHLAANVDSPDYQSRETECVFLVELGDEPAAAQCYEALTADYAQGKFWLQLYYYRQQYPEVLALTRERVALDPSPFNLFQLAFALMANQEWDKARQIYSRLFTQFFGEEDFTLKQSDLFQVVASGVALYRSGDTDRGNRLFDKALNTMEAMHRTRGYASGIFDIYIHVVRDDRDKAIAALREVKESGWVGGWWRLRAPIFAPMSEESAWQALIAEMESDIALQRAVYQAHKDDHEYWRCRGGRSC